MVLSVPNFFEALRFRYWHCNERLDVGCHWVTEHILESHTISQLSVLRMH